MNDKILQQNLNDKAQRSMLMAQLLFREKTPEVSADKIKSALEKYLGKTKKVGDNDKFFMFSVKKYKVVFEDVPEGIPPLASFTGPQESFNGEKIDELARSQFWDIKNGNEIVNECKYCLNIFSYLASALDYREQAEFFLAQIGAALYCYPSCEAILAFPSKKLTTPEQFRADEKLILGNRFIKMAVNARLFNIQDSPDMVVDTFGFFAFGKPDVQLHFHGLDPNYAVMYAYNIANYQFSNNFPIKDGDTIDGLGKDGNITANIQWKTQYEESIIQPIRPILDINCGEYASGKRYN